MWEFPKIGGYLIWGPYDKNPTISALLFRVLYQGPVFSETSMCRVLYDFMEALGGEKSQRGAGPGFRTQKRGALIISSIGFWGILYYSYNKEPPK